MQQNKIHITDDKEKKLIHLIAKMYVNNILKQCGDSKQNTSVERNKAKIISIK